MAPVAATLGASLEEPFDSVETAHSPTRTTPRELHQLLRAAALKGGRARSVQGSGDSSVGVCAKLSAARR